MTGTIDDQYFEWLYSHIGSVRNRNPARSIWHLAHQLYTTEYVWLVANDDNRVEDGRELRQEFMEQQSPDEVPLSWLELGCSMLEMMIALGRRASFEANGSPGDWFWTFLKHLDIFIYDDAFDSEAAKHVEKVLERFIYRNYDFSGEGGLFPLRRAERDQRKIELWYQMAAYIGEM
jgi:hypothetical protein